SSHRGSGWLCAEIPDETVLSSARSLPVAPEIFPVAPAEKHWYFLTSALGRHVRSSLFPGTYSSHLLLRQAGARAQANGRGPAEQHFFPPLPRQARRGLRPARCCAPAQ